MSTLADRIKSERKAKKLTQEALGKFVGVGKSSVSQWESGLTKNMDGTNMIMTAKALGVDPNWLATGQGDKYVNYEKQAIQKHHVQDKTIHYLLTQKEIALLNAFKRLTGDQQDNIVANAFEIAQKNEKIIKELMEK